jgi:hypothetical protein
MDETTSLLICLGASVAANCVDCFRHYHREAQRIGLAPPDIDAAVALGAKVKTGANIAIMSAVADATGRKDRQSAVREDPVPSCCPR